MGETRRGFPRLSAIGALSLAVGACALGAAISARAQNPFPALGQPRAPSQPLAFNRGVAPVSPTPLALPAPSLTITTPAISLAPEQIRANAQSRVFQLVTRVRGGGDKQSYGSAFVVQAIGWLLTNYHVVSQVLADPERYDLELDLGNKTEVPATIEAFDVPNDLALVRVGHAFASAYSLAVRQPSPGEKLYSMGLPQDTVMTIIEGLYSDTGRMGPLLRSLMSAPLNHGMSGGPVVNSADELVGVNDAILPDAQSISVLIPAKEIGDFLGRGMRAQGLSALRAPASATALTTEIPAQITAILQPWIAQWKEQTESSTFAALGHYEIAPPPTGLKCWEDSKATTVNQADSRTRVCSTLGAFPLFPGHSGGQLTLRYSSFGGGLTASSLASSAASAGVSTSEDFGLGRFLSSDLFLEQVQRGAAGRFHDIAAIAKGGKREMVCHHRFLKNRRGVELVAEYCASEARPVQGVFDLVLTVAPIGQSDLLVAELDLTGFTEKELLTAGETFLDGIALARPKGVTE